MRAATVETRPAAPHAPPPLLHDLVLGSEVVVAEGGRLSLRVAAGRLASFARMREEEGAKRKQAVGLGVVLLLSPSSSRRQAPTDGRARAIGSSTASDHDTAFTAAALRVP